MTRARYIHGYRVRADQVVARGLRLLAVPLWYVVALAGGLAEVLEAFADQWAGRS